MPPEDEMTEVDEEEEEEEEEEEDMPEHAYLRAFFVMDGLHGESELNRENEL